jgi:tetratricopeptide (TPR) repeat protein
MKINNAFLALMNSLVDKDYSDYAIYTTSEIEQNNQERFGKDYIRIPEGIIFRLTKDKNLPVTPEPDLQYTISNEKDYYHNFIMNAYYTYYVQRANFLMNKNEFDTAEKLLQKALELSPQDKTVYNLRNKINQLKSLPKKP